MLGRVIDHVMGKKFFFCNIIVEIKLTYHFDELQSDPHTQLYLNIRLEQWNTIQSILSLHFYY